MKVIHWISAITMVLVLASTTSFSQIKHQEHYDSGKIKSTIFEERGLLYVIRFYENGTIWQKGTYSDLQKHGKFQSWYENGERHMEIEFSKDKPRGDWKIWNEEGKMMILASYREGKFNSGSQWDESGNLIAQR